MNFDETRFRRVEEIFHSVSGLPAGADRERAITEACKGDRDLASEVAGLLQAEAASRAFRAPEESPPAAYPRFGGFQAEAVLGHGGAGVVYLAGRSDGLFEQKVAIKVLQPSAGPPVHEGFADERRILARLRHPGIAQIFDGGVTDEGMPYLVMEYIDGLPLDEYCRIHRLDFDARIGLLREVCEAIIYAHRNLVVHLDLKPSNILVNAEGRPKLLDFGTAKILASYDVGATQVMATPRYASPEQLRGEHAGIPADVFSLGVLWAELLTGHWPFGDPKSRLNALQRATEDVELHSLEIVSSEHAESCQSSPSKLRARIGGDLAAILRKAVSFDPGSRYATAEDLLRDLDRFRRGYPVEARRASLADRVRRFVLRNRILVANLAGVLMLLGAFAAFQVHMVRRQTAIREATQDGLMKELSLVMARTDPAPDSRLMLSRVAQDLEKQKISWAGHTWYFWSGNLRVRLGELNFSRYSKSLNDANEAVQEFEQAARDYRQDSNVTPGSWLEMTQVKADALLEVGRAQEGIRALASTLAANPKVEPEMEANVAGYWDMLADWLGAWETSCEPSPRAPPVRACQTPLFYTFALEGAAGRYATGYQNTPSPIIARHYADLLIRLGRIDDAQALLERLPMDSAPVQRLLGDAEFKRRQYALAVQHYRSALKLLPEHPTEVFQLRTRGRTLVELGRAEYRANSREAAADASAGLELLSTLAEYKEATSDVLELAACDYLMAEPAALRNPKRAEVLARRAVEITGGQVVPFLVTLAHATGAEEDISRAAQAEWRQGEMLRPIVPRAWQARLEASQEKAKSLRAGNAR